MAQASRRLVLLFDGTWNDPVSRTNVYRLAGTIADFDGDTEQLFFYNPGVGTGRFGRFLGGATGYGLSAHLFEGYDWLSRHYRENDEVYVFGFSRGAYTARSLVGLIRKCGLPAVITPQLIAAAEKLYRNTDVHPDDQLCTNFRRDYGPSPAIRFLGVWDTVGALGVPGTMLTEKAGGRYSWHDTQLSGLVERAFHALALDEHRAAYEPALWWTPDGLPKPGNVEIEQRWFAGAHADVGGGYPDSGVAGLALRWLMDRAEAAGLVLAPFAPEQTAAYQPLHDSYAAFMGGLYRVYRERIQRDGRFHRRLDRAANGEKAVNVTIDGSVWRRWHADPDYRPRSLIDGRREPPAP